MPFRLARSQDGGETFPFTDPFNSVDKFTDRFLINLATMGGGGVELSHPYPRLRDYITSTRLTY